MGPLNSSMVKKKREIALGLANFTGQAQMTTPIYFTHPLNLQGHSGAVESSYFQVRTGIGNVISYLHKFGKTKDSLCNFCNRGKQIMQHLILHGQTFEKKKHIKKLRAP